MKLHQLLAILTSVKTVTEKNKTELYKTIQKASLFEGMTKKFKPREEDGYTYPSENVILQERVEDVVRKYVEINSELIDLAYAQDVANTNAKADLIVDGTVIVKDLPVPNLLFLEKQLQDIKTILSKLPTRDVNTKWHEDANKGCAVSDKIETVKTKKVTEFVVAYEATKEHPAQVKEVSKDIIEGTWEKELLTGAIGYEQLKILKEKADKLYKAVVIAREQANQIEITENKISDKLFNYLFSGIIK